MPQTVLPLMDVEVLEPIALRMPLVIDFGSTNTTAGVYLDALYFEPGLHWYLQMPPCTECVSCPSHPRQGELELMTTHQLREICRREKIVHGILNPLDKEELV